MDYKKLRKVDVTNHIEKKGRFSYVSWTWAVDTLLLNDPEATWSYEPETVYPDGTMMTHCAVFAFNKRMEMQLPVLDHRNKPIANPNAFDINTARMRCLVKAIALFGIGLHVYAGEDLPPGDSAQDISNNKFWKDCVNKAADQETLDKCNQFESWFKTEAKERNLSKDDVAVFEDALNNRKSQLA